MLTGYSTENLWTPRVIVEKKHYLAFFGLWKVKIRWLESERALPSSLCCTFALNVRVCATASFLQVCPVLLSLCEHNIPASVSRYRFCFGTFEKLKRLCVIYQLSLCVCLITHWSMAVVSLLYLFFYTKECKSLFWTDKVSEVLKMLK